MPYHFCDLLFEKILINYRFATDYAIIEVWLIKLHCKQQDFAQEA